MSADVCPVCNEAYLRVSAGDVKWWDRPCRHKYAGPCEHAESLAISRAAEIERLKAENAELLAELVTTADFFAHYSFLNECGQADIEDDAQNRIASARALITRHSLNETNQETST